jgi:hypothetical protein
LVTGPAAEWVRLRKGLQDEERQAAGPAAARRLAPLAAEASGPAAPSGAGTLSEEALLAAPLAEA